MTDQAAAPDADGVRGGGLLTVHAHPDDETLANGALLATWAAAARPVTVVTCTRGERGEVIGEHLAHLAGDGPALAGHRTGELARALAALGVTDHVFLDSLSPSGAAGGRLVDSGMTWLGPGQAAPAPDAPSDAFSSADLEALADDLAELIVDRRPDVVVCDEPGGGYGHPDHVRAHQLTMRAVERAASRHRVAVVLWSAVDADALRAGWAALAPGTDGLTAPGTGAPVPSGAVDRSKIGVVVGVGPVLDQVLDALRAHATQVQAVRRLADDAPDDTPGQGLGDDAGTDPHDGDADRGSQVTSCWPAAPPPALGSFALSNGVLAPVLLQESYRCAPGSDVRAVAWPTGVRLLGDAGGAGSSVTGHGPR
ncbi:MAG: GlcNAc-PI de-N-acetylase [Actinotalea sp.]|nr:GlcNAc-PI de-N-acetylase [Actinotalea sp.]